RYPEVTAACWFLDRVVNLTDEGVDVAVRIGELPDSSLQAVRVGSVRRVICAAPSYLDAHGEPQQPEDLLNHTLISANAVTPAPEWRFRVDGETRSVRVLPRLLTTTNDAAIAAAVGGFGLSRLMSYQVDELVRCGQLQRVLERFELAPLPVHLVHREGRHASLKARAFIDLALERLRERLAPRT
ncbi:MAG: LysR family transcriptional regulator, partial [Curvibacter sp.]